MMREEFEDWLEERKLEAFDDMPQSDATSQRWAARFYAALKAIADQETADEAEADPEADELFEDEDVEETADEGDGA